MIVEVFTGGCPCCDEAAELVSRVARSTCEIEFLDIRLPHAQERAKHYDIKRLPAIVVDGKLATCCEAGVDEASLRICGVAG
jgi:glutaredoxin 3